MENNKRTKWIHLKLAVLSCLLVVLVIAGVMGGAVRISFEEFTGIFTDQELTNAGRILLFVRLPRVAGAVVAGMGLAVAGAIIQIVLNNPLAGPNIIGVNAGSGLAVVLCAVLLPGSIGMLPFAAFGGAFATVIFVYYLGRKTGSSKITLVLAGVAINSLLNSATDFIYTISEESLIAGNLFQIGGLNGIQIPVLKCAAVVVILSLFTVLLFHNELEIFSLGEERARTLGLSVSFYRFLFLGLAAALAGAAVSFAGLLGFLGLIVPHMARLLVGEECIYYIPASGLLGAALLLCCDYIARIWFAPFELPVGIVLSFVGAPYFMWLLYRNRGKKNA